MNILISACLAGFLCRYDGKEQKLNIQSKREDITFIPFCPEIYGGLETPRAPCEIKDGRVIDNKGNDKTQNFNKGALEALKLAKLYDCRYAVLKQNSPSCGFGKIYDGSFSKTLINGNGITADLLSKNGIKIFGESQLDELYKSI